MGWRRVQCGDEVAEQGVEVKGWFRMPGSEGGRYGVVAIPVRPIFVWQQRQSDLRFQSDQPDSTIWNQKMTRQYDWEHNIFIGCE